MIQPQQPKQSDRAVGVQLQNLRIFKGYSREEAAERLSATSDHLEAIEEGSIRPEPALLFEMAGVYEVPASRVFAVAGATLNNSL